VDTMKNLRIPNLKLRTTKHIRITLPEYVADAIDRILQEDKRQKAYLAGIDEDKYNYLGLTPREIAEKLQDRGIEWK